MTPERDGVVRIGAVGDLHMTKTGQGSLQPMLSAIADEVDVLVLPGDLTDFGLPDEARALVKELNAVKVPVVAVLGNHDFESDKQDEVKAILVDAGINLLDGDSCEVEGIGFAGAKGFAGGFGQHVLGPWGEPAIKQFVRDAVDEALKLETALQRLRTPRRVVVVHYSPIEDTVRGEPAPIYPFLGSSRLAEPIERFPVTAVFHGHAHHGSAEGRMKNGVPVYNVSLPLLRRVWPDRPPVRIVELRVDETVDAESTSATSV